MKFEPSQMQPLARIMYSICMHYVIAREKFLGLLGLPYQEKSPDACSEHNVYVSEGCAYTLNANNALSSMFRRKSRYRQCIRHIHS